MAKVPFVTCDVFTDRRFGGNPLAVFPDARPLPEGELQTIAREFNLSETVFVYPAGDADRRRRLRIFTPASELPFAGHPTVGAALMLHELGAFGAQAAAAAVDIVFEEGAGPVPVRIARAEGGTRATLTAPRLPEREAAKLDRAALARSLSLPLEALAPSAEPGICSAGLRLAFVPLRDAAALSSARIDAGAPRNDIAGQQTPAGFYLFTLADWRQGREIRARMFAPDLGVAEDPATGSAAAALPAALAEFQALPAEGTVAWRIRQGEEMGRPSVIHVEADRRAGRFTAVRVGGAAVLMTKGELLLP